MNAERLQCIVPCTSCERSNYAEHEICCKCTAKTTLRLRLIICHLCTYSLYVLKTFAYLLIVGKSFLVVPFSVKILLIAAVSNRVWKNTEERQLLIEPGDAFGSRVMKSPRPVIAENVAKRFWVAIEEILSTSPTEFISYAKHA